eukprot:GEMP01076755.1.p1 GENE.GEMP01076755.1~~GEMP01076755.1.p1  ORF type:complete len:147 (+),score=26.57 GEMP01076755.1:40-441(+)
MTDCTVCREAPSKYRFPCCRERYCSVNCYKVHGDCRKNAELEAPVEESAKRSLEEMIEMDDDELLSSEQLNKIRRVANSQWKDLMESKRFRQVLLDVDSKETQKKRVEALERRIETDRTLVKWIDELADVLAT